MEVFKLQNFTNINNKNRLKYSDNLSYKDFLSSEMNFSDMRFKENLQKINAPWDNIMNKMTSTAQGNFKYLFLIKIKNRN